MTKKDRIRIVCYEEPTEWILGKFALKMQECLTRVGADVDIGKRGAADTDIAHHIAYAGPDERRASIETFMITHLDTPGKIQYVAQKFAVWEMGICMSWDHRDFLVRVGLPAECMCYVNPAQDGVIRPRPIVLGIASKVHDDGRKNEWAVVDALKDFPPDAFILKIMGSGWEEMVASLRAHEIAVEHHPVFQYDTYIREFMPSLDYFIYFSHDEGSMAYLDAIAADVKTIVTPQGYHLDVPDGIDHVINDMHDMRAVFAELHGEREKRTGRMERWNWMEYTWRHMVIWDYLRTIPNPDVAAQQKVFLQLLPSIAPHSATALQTELGEKPVPRMEALLEAAELAGRHELRHFAAQCERRGLVFYPKEESLRSAVLASYPAFKRYLA